MREHKMEEDEKMENCQSHWAGRRSRTAFKDFPIPWVLITWNSTTCSLSKISKKKPSVMEVEVGDDLFLLRMRFFFSIITWKHHARCFRQTSCKRSVWTMFYYFVINICSICWWQHCVLLADVFNLDIKATTIIWLLTNFPFIAKYTKDSQHTKISQH